MAKYISSQVMLQQKVLSLLSNLTNKPFQIFKLFKGKLLKENPLQILRKNRVYRTWYGENYLNK